MDLLFGGGSASRNILGRVNSLHDMHKKGMSWEAMSKETGLPMSQIQNFADKNYSGYGVSKPKSQSSGNDTRSSQDTAASAPVSDGYGTYDPYYAAEQAAAARQAQAQAAEDARQRDFTIGQIDEQIRRYEGQLGNLDQAFNSGRTQIEDLYNKNHSRLNQQQGRALSGLETQRGDTQRDFHNMDADVNRTARNSYQALQSLLSRSGAGSSSAMQELVPYAVSNDASRTRGKEAESFGRVYRDIDIKKGETEEDYQNRMNDLNDQKRSNLKNLDADTQANRRTINEGIGSLRGQRVQAEGGNWQQAREAMTPYQQEVSALDKALATLADKYRNPYQVGDVQVRKADMHNYSVDPSGVKVDDPSGTGTDTDTSAAYRKQIEDEEKRKREQSSFAGAY